MTKEEALNTLMKMRAWRAWGKEQKEEERPEMPEQKEVDEAFDVCIEMLSRPTLPSNLDEAADKYLRNIEDEVPKIRYPHGPEWTDIYYGFKAGAEWIAGQGVSFDTEMSWLDSFGFQIGWPEDTSIFDCFNEGDKVIVQIRKK